MFTSIKDWIRKDWVMGVFAVCIALMGVFSAAFFVLSAGTLTSTNVEPAVLNAGSTSTVTVSFTTATTIPPAGKIKVTFPGGFNISGATGGACSSMDGTFATSVSGQTITLTRQGDGTDQTSGSAETCTINSVANPIVAAQAGTYTITTTDGGDTILDTDGAVASDNILAGMLSNTNVEPASLTSAASSTVTVTFTTVNILEGDGKVVVTFPAGFNVSGATGAACSGMDGTFTTAVNNFDVTITRAGGSPRSPGPQTCTINSVINPVSTGATGTYTIKTQNGSSQLHDIGINIPGDTIIASVISLTSTNVEPATLTTGTPNTVTVTFTTTRVAPSAIPANGKIRVTFPTGFGVSGASGGTCSTIDGTFVTSVSGQSVTLTRQADGTAQTNAAESCTINNVINPGVAGVTGTYSIEILDNANSALDLDTAVTGDSIVASALTSVNVEPGSLVQGTTNVVTVTFTTNNPLEASGKVKVTFPAGFGTGGASGGTCSTMDGSFSTSVSGQDVVMVRSGGTMEPPGAQTCTINNVVNPNSLGVTGSYAVSTTTSGDQAHDVAQNVPGDTIVASAPTLSATNVEPASLGAGASGSVTISFTTTSNIPTNGKIKITFPSGFNVSTATGGTCSTMDGSFVTSVNAQGVTLTRQNDGTLQTPGVETCTLNNIINPSVAGTTGTYAIATLTSANAAIDTDASVAADTVTAGVLTLTNVEPASLVVATSTTVTVTFTTVNLIESDGKILIAFPEAFNLTGVSGGTCSSMDGSFTTSVNGQQVTLTRSGGSSENSGPQTCTIGNVFTPSVAGSTGTYTIQTSNSGGIVHDADTAVVADVILAGALTNTNVQPASLVAGTVNTITVSFTTATSLESNGFVYVTFPAGFNVAGATGGACSTMDGSFATTVNGQVVKIARSGGGIEAPGPQICTISGIVNPSFAGSTGTYTIVTTTSGDKVHDNNIAVSADTITSAALSATNVEPASLTVSLSTTVTLSFTTANIIESTGKIKVTFPAGFDVTGATGGTCSTMDGAFATGVSGQTVTLTRSGGSVASSGVHTCTIASIVNPATSGDGGMYTLTTTDGNDAVHDADASVAGDVFIAAEASGHGTAYIQPREVLTYAISLSEPAGGTYAEGDFLPIVWSTSAGTGDPSYITLSYSTDGGTFWTTIVTNTANDGGYGWIVPAVNASHVIVRAQATDLVDVLATGTSEEFILGSGDPESDTSAPSETDSTESTDPVTPFETPLPEEDASTSLVGSFVRGTSSSAVYYLDSDGMRRLFPDQQTFFTYADSFENVKTITDEVLEQYPEGELMGPNPGTVLVKIPTKNYVYALEHVSGALTIHWLASEDVARAIYGNRWADYVIDVLADVFKNFVRGSDITSPADATGGVSGMRTRRELNTH